MAWTDCCGLRAAPHCGAQTCHTLLASCHWRVSIRSATYTRERASAQDSGCEGTPNNRLQATAYSVRSCVAPAFSRA